MSKRTAEANKAISKAWKNEQELVKVGKGTRDWTPNQQQDILEYGKAYDDDGRTFEGQHMKSVEEYPEYQGEPGNIQFLTRNEHLEAHGYNWHNATNWYFNPVTKEKTDFGDGKYIPCEIIELSNSIVVIQSNESNEKIINENIDETKNVNQDNLNNIRKVENENTILSKAKKCYKNTKNAVIDINKDVKKTVKTFIKKHPTATKIVFGIAAAVGVVASTTQSNDSNNNNSFNNNDDNSYKDSNYELDTNVIENYDSTDSNRKNIEERLSPCEHKVKEHTQHYHTKDGVIEKSVATYTRGGKEE